MHPALFLNLQISEQRLNNDKVTLLFIKFDMDSRVSPEERFDPAMCDFSVLNHFQIWIADATELIFLNDDFAIALWTFDGDLLCRLADGVVGYDFFKLKWMLWVEELKVGREDLNANFIFGWSLDTEISILLEFNFGLECFFVLAFVC